MSDSEPQNSNQPPQEQSIATQLDSLADEISRLTRPHDMLRRIELCRQALALVERVMKPEEWAWWHVQLANSLQQNPLGSRADNLEQAIHHYEQALSVRTRQAYPSDWAMTQNNLATALSDRIRGERGENLERAIFHANQALEVRTPQAYPSDWAVTQNNLANALSLRIRGERGENLERAIGHYQQALEVSTRQAYPFNWAQTQNNLALAYRNRIRGERGENLERAIGHYEQALSVFTRQAYPEKWATTQNNLAIAYCLRIRGERGENLERAIEHYEQGLEIYTRQAFPEKWALTQNNLAIAYADRIRGERGENLERAIGHYEQALSVRTRQAYPSDWAGTQNNLALAYCLRIRGERGENLERAIEHYEQALEVRTPQNFPQDCRDTAYWLGDLLYGEERFSEAREAFVMAHEAVEVLRGEVVREEAKLELAEQNAELYAHLVYCCLYDANADEAAAFEYTVAGKGRAFVDMLITTPFDFASLGAEEPELAADWRRVGELRQEVDLLQLQLSGERGRGAADVSLERELRAALEREWRSKQEALSKHWQQMNRNYPILSATESAPTLSAAQACELAGEVAATLVEYVRHAEGWGAFVVSAEGLRYVPLPLVDESLLEGMEKWVAQLKSRWGRGKISYKRLSVWHEALIAPLSLPASEGKLVAEGVDAMPVASKPSATRPLPHSPTPTLAILAPFGRLHLLPLAALRAADNAPYLAAQYSLSFVPTLGALRVLRDEHGKDEAATSELQALLSVAYPGTPPLPNVLPEAQVIMGYFAESTLLHEAAATPDAVLEAALGKQLIHLGCHGWFDSQHPTESGLMLEGGWLTVQRIISELNLKQSILATLAACESGKSHVRRGDEYVGLMQAIMTAGAKSVVASLWNINDTATRALFEAFYVNLTQGQAPVLALQQAQQALRQRAHWKHPYYWAAFTVNGLAHQAALAPAPHRPIAQANLSEHLDQLNRASQQGGHPMNEEQMKAEAAVILDQLIEYPADIQAALNPSQAAILLDALNALAERTAHAENEADLLRIAHAIQILAEELLPLRDLLLEEDTDIAKAQKERAVTLQNHEKSDKGDKEAQKAMPSIRNDLVKAHEALTKHLPDPPPPPPNNESWRDRLWKKMGLR